jgi:hypothetical protein
MSPAILMWQKYTSCTNPHHISSQVCMLPLPVYVPVSAPPVIWHSAERMLVRITCVSGNADGTKGESINHHPTPLSPTSPSCTASVQMCRSDSVPLFYGGYGVSATWPARFYQDQMMNQQPIKYHTGVFSNPHSHLGGPRFKVWPINKLPWSTCLMAFLIFSST